MNLFYVKVQALRRQDDGFVFEYKLPNSDGRDTTHTYHLKDLRPDVLKSLRGDNFMYLVFRSQEDSLKPPKIL
jgi:hypothetical protein